MKSFSQMMRKKYKDTNKKSIAIYLILRLLVILSAIIQLFLGNWLNVALCILALILFTLPTLISERFDIAIPSMLEASIYLFIYASAILGEINNFYSKISFWDTILHTLNGFICAGIGFSSINLFSKNRENTVLLPLCAALFAFCFSMTVGVLWEFFEFSADRIVSTDMQKDRIVTSISTVKLNAQKENSPVMIESIERTEIYSKDGTVTRIENGYLDIGLIDTIKDLFFNFIGAAFFSIFATASAVSFFPVRDRKNSLSCSTF